MPLKLGTKFIFRGVTYDGITSICNDIGICRDAVYRYKNRLLRDTELTKEDLTPSVYVSILEDLITKRGVIVKTIRDKNYFTTIVMPSTQRI